MTYVIAEPRVDVRNKACVEECPVDCDALGSSGGAAGIGPAERDHPLIAALPPRLGKG